jgi:hypothetical protein
MTKVSISRFIAPLRRIKWVVYCKAASAGPEQVLRYLSRYTHRVAISNRRLVAADDGAIAFRWKDYRVNGPDRWKTMRLHPHEFIRRFLMHVLPRVSTASATTGSLPTPAAPRTSRQPAHFSISPRLPPIPNNNPMLPRTRCVCCPGHAVLWRAYDRHRDLRARLRAEVAADTKQDRHVMRQTACKRCGLPLPIRWPRAGGDLAQPNGIHQSADRPLTRSERPPKCLLHSPDLACVQTSRSRRAGVPPTIETATNIKSS